MYNSKFIKLLSLEMFYFIEKNFYNGVGGQLGGDMDKTNEIREGSELRDMV